MGAERSSTEGRDEPFAALANLGRQGPNSGSLLSRSDSQSVTCAQGGGGVGAEAATFEQQAGALDRVGRVAPGADLVELLDQRGQVFGATVLVAPDGGFRGAGQGHDHERWA